MPAIHLRESSYETGRLMLDMWAHKEGNKSNNRNGSNRKIQRRRRYWNWKCQGACFVSKFGP